jgi:hypothetical protein
LNEACAETVEDSLNRSLLLIINLKSDLVLEVGNNDGNNVKIKKLEEIIVSIMEDLEKGVQPE